MTIYNLGNIKGEKGDKGDSITGATGPVGVGIKSIEQITYRKFKFCLTDGSEYIMDYSDEPPFDGITITSDKDIIVTGETATITAQLTSQGQPASIGGETVTFEVRKQSDDSLIETLTDVTDNAGVATVSYLGQGTGDIYIKAECMILTETYGIEDCIKYFNSEYTSSYNFDYALPSTFKIEYEALYSEGTASYLIVGESESKSLLTGHVSSTETNYSVWARNGSDSKNFGSQMVYNSYISQTISYDGTIYNFNDDIIISNLNGVNPSKLIKIGNYNTGWKFRNIKIKPL